MKIRFDTAAVRRKHTLLPFLVVLFLISYGLLTMMVVEQNRTISSQRTLIHLLFKDSLHLSALRKAEKQKIHPPGTEVSSVQGNTRAHSGKIPVIQVPQQKSQAGQVASGKTGVNSGRKQKAQKKAPSRPPSELTDPSDIRRVSVAI